MVPKLQHRSGQKNGAFVVLTGDRVGKLGVRHFVFAIIVTDASELMFTYRRTTLDIHQATCSGCTYQFNIFIVLLVESRATGRDRGSYSGLEKRTRVGC